jgi:hypothetical protein
VESKKSPLQLPFSVQYPTSFLQFTSFIICTDFDSLLTGGYLKKNLYVEENAGIRENGYKTFQFNGSNLVNMFFFLILPGTLFTYAAMDEMIIKDQQLGRKREYGLLPKDISSTK